MRKTEFSSTAKIEQTLSYKKGMYKSQNGFHKYKNIQKFNLFSDSDQPMMYYPRTQGLGFLGLHRRPMSDYISYLLLNKFVLVP